MRLPLKSCLKDLFLFFEWNKQYDGVGRRRRRRESERRKAAGIERDVESANFIVIIIIIVIEIVIGYRTACKQPIRDI